MGDEGLGQKRSKLGIIAVFGEKMRDKRSRKYYKSERRKICRFNEIEGVHRVKGIFISWMGVSVRKGRRLN